jgi:glycosyltransferase involved in cell wall biosynthesis
MRLIIVSTFWNSEEFVGECIKSLKSQYYTNFTAYFIDDMSTDSSYEVAKNAIDGDERFILIKNDVKKFKCKNFIDVIRDNSKLKWNDVIVEIDGDDKLSNNHVLGLINKVYTDDNIWICGSKWKDSNGNISPYSRMDADNPRKTKWGFSHLRTYRVFLFRLIQDRDLKYNNEYLKAGVDIGIGLPMLEMSGNEHYHFLDEVTYIYTWHKNQSYSVNNSINDDKIQYKTASHVYSLPPYNRVEIVFGEGVGEITEKLPTQGINVKNPVTELLKTINYNPSSNTDYGKINQILSKNEVVNKQKPQPQPQPKPKQNIPVDRNQIQQMKRDSLVNLAKKMGNVRPTTQNQLPHVFGGRSRQ